MRKASRLALVLITLLAGFSLHRSVARGGAESPISGTLRELPLAVGSWRGVEDALPLDVLAALRVDDYVYRRYRDRAGAPITLYLAYYGRQHLDERVHSPAGCLPAGGWFPVSTGVQEIGVPGTPPRRVVANRYLIEKGTDRQVVLYWFQGRGRILANEIQAALFLAFDTLTGRGSGEMLVRVNALVRTSPSATLAEELQFVQTFYPRLAGLAAR